MILLTKKRGRLETNIGAAIKRIQHGKSQRLVESSGTQDQDHKNWVANNSLF